MRRTLLLAPILLLALACGRRADDCALNATCPPGGAGAAGTSCTTAADCDDHNPCTEDACQSGACEHVAADGATPDDGDACTADTCQAGEPFHVIIAGMPCPGPAGEGVCSATGICFSCDDGAQTGDETGVDCGGSCPRRCDGDLCNSLNDCKSGICQDGVCCAASCKGTCMACNLQGSMGTCSNVPLGSEDPGTCESLPNTPRGCNGKGACKKGGGVGCIEDTECMVQCFLGHCLIPNGSACADPTTCASRRCSGGKCAPCTSGGQCASGVCEDQVCKATPGWPCETAEECPAGICIYGLCKLDDGSACSEDIECVFGLCHAGKCSKCDATHPCKNNMSCTNNLCLLPPGEYCAFDVQCDSNSCTGFPLRCE